MYNSIFHYNPKHGTDPNNYQMMTGETESAMSIEWSIYLIVNRNKVLIYEMNRRNTILYKKKKQSNTYGVTSFI